MPVRFQMWDRIRALTKKANIYRTDNLYADQDVLDRVMSGGQFLDFGKQSALLEQTNLQINRLERYKDYDMMDEVGEVSLALDMYSDEASLVDPERKHSVLVKAKNERVKKIVEDLLYNTLMLDRDIRPMIRYLCKFGDMPLEIVPTKNRDGVASYRFINVYNFTRIQTKFGDLVGFYYQDAVSAEPIFLHPWQVSHMRLTSFESLYTPYGKSILDGGRKDFKRLRLMEDAALVYRLTRAPEKRIFSIPVGNIPPKEVPQYIELLARQMKKHKFIDPATGNVNERYHPLIQDDDFWLPKRADGSGPTIDTLPGAQNLDQIADIEYFKKKMVAGLKIPYSRVGIGDAADSDGRSLASVSPEFAKSIQWIQREVVHGLKKIVLVHLALRGNSVADMESFDLHMTAASAIDELYRIETWATRADIMNNLKDLGWFPPEWIIERFTDLTPDEIVQMEASRGNTISEPDMNEGSDPEEQKFLSEALNMIDDAQRKIRLLESLNSKPIVITNSPKSYVNENEFDGLPDKSGNVVIESRVESDISESVKKETRDLLVGDLSEDLGGYNVMSQGDPEVIAESVDVDDIVDNVSENPDDDVL